MIIRMFSSFRKKIFNTVLLKIFPLLSKRIYERYASYRSKIYKKGEIALICLEESSPWDSSYWIKNQIQKMENIGKFISKDSSFSCLELCINLIKENRKNINIIDYGGGGGLYYEKIKRYIYSEPKIKINYNIVDSERNLSICEKYLKETIHCKLNLINSESFNNFNLQYGDKKFDIILLSAVLQYLNKWQESLKLLINFSPEYICILHAPIAINSNEEARAIQNVKTSEGYCGPAMITLFPRRLIEEFMNKNKYALLSSFPLTKKSKDYYRTGCDNDLYKDVIHWNYIFKKIN